MKEGGILDHFQLPTPYSQIGSLQQDLLSTTY